MVMTASSYARRRTAHPAFQIVNLEQQLGIPVPRVPLEVVPDNTEGAARPVLQTKTADDAILETYIKHRKLSGYI